MLDSISTALRKSRGNSLTASEIRNMNTSHLRNLIFSDQAYIFMKNIKGSPAYWQRFMYDVLAMIKQLGPPSWWMTFSCADLRWNEIYKILSKLQGKELTDQEIDLMTYNEKCKMLNSNPVVVAKHFQYRLEILFKEVLLGSGEPIGKILYDAIRIEFQFHGSAHAHCFVWVESCPLLTDENFDMLIEFIDRSISACLPDKIQLPELHSLVETYQTHSHSKTCKKYRNVPCRFNFGHFFTKKTIVTKPLSQELHENLRAAKLKEREDILSKVKVFIDEVLNPAKAEKYKPDLTFEQILDSLDITEEQYYEALSISVSNDHEIHLKRSPDSCFINNYSPTVLTAWQANIDIQPVFDYYKCVIYLCSYMSKGETECSEAIRAAASEARKDNLEIKETLKKIGAASLCSREVSSQECMYHCLPELWLRKTFPQTVFINTDSQTREFE